MHIASPLYTCMHIVVRVFTLYSRFTKIQLLIKLIQLHVSSILDQYPAEWQFQVVVPK